MKELGRFDPNLQMFVEKPKVASIDHLKFLRFKAERGDFGYKPYSTPRGDNLFRLSNDEIAKYAIQQADQTPDQKLRQHIAANGSY